MICALIGIGVAAPTIASAEPPSTFFCVYNGNGDTGDSICAQHYTVFTPFIINSYFNLTQAAWCIETVNGKIIAVPSGKIVDGNANIDAILIAPCAELA
jgi:hypothetical protein